MAARSATIRCSYSSLRGWPRAGGRSSAYADVLARYPADCRDDAVMPVICRTCQTPSLLRRWVDRMKGLRHGGLRLQLQPRLGRCHLCADLPGSFAGGTVTRHNRRLHLELVPWSMVENQYADQA